MAIAALAAEGAGAAGAAEGGALFGSKAESAAGLFGGKGGGGLHLPGSNISKAMFEKIGEPITPILKSMPQTHMEDFRP